MLLAFVARKHQLRDLINRLQEKLLDKSRELQDAQQYAASIGDGAVSIYDIANAPSSMRNRMVMYTQYSHNMAFQSSQAQYQQMRPMVLQQMTGMDPNAQLQYENWVQQQMYKQERDRFAKMEEKVLNQQEKKLQQEKDKIETQLKLAEQELESVKKAEEKGVEQLAPKYVA